jgi:hypothetical protein
MIKRILFVFIAILNLQMSGQKLVYTSNGTVTDSNANVISPAQVEVLLKDNETLLRSYIAAKSKQSVGNIMLYGGLGIITTDVIVGAVSDTVYPTFFTFIGGITTLIAIPVKMGFQKKIKNVVSEYNTKNGFTYNQKTDSKFEMISTNNGIGMRLTFN